MGAGILMNETKGTWFPPEMARQRWDDLADETKDRFADDIRLRHIHGAFMDRGALAAAAEARPSGPRTMFDDSRIAGVREYGLKRQVRAANENTGVAIGTLPQGRDVGYMVTEMRSQVGGGGYDKLPNGQSDPRSSAAAFMSYFGKPPEGVPLDPWLGVPREYHDFPDYLKTKKPQYLESIIMNSVASYGSWHLDVFAPFRVLTTNEIGLVKWEFNPGLGKRTAYEAPVTILSHQQTTTKQSTIRFGLGIHMELGFWNTDLGRWLFARQVEQMTNAVYLTMILAAEYALYHAGKVDQTLEQILNMPMEEAEFWRRMKDEDRVFDAPRKRGGMAALINAAREQFRRAGKNPGQMHMVLPESVMQAYKANGFNESGLGGVKAIHTSVPIRTEKHGEREASRNTITTGGYAVLNPADPFQFGDIMDAKTFKSDLVGYGRYFDTLDGPGWTTHQQLFKNSLMYHYPSDHRGDAGGDAKDQPPGGKGYWATPDVGFQFLCNAQLQAEMKAAAGRELNLEDLYEEYKRGQINDRKRFPTAGELFAKLDSTKEAQLKAIINARVEERRLPAPHNTYAALMNMVLSTSEFFDICYAADIPVFIPLIDAAPHQQRQAQTVSFFIEGNAWTYLGYPMAMMGTDPVIATASLSLWWHSKCVTDNSGIINFHTAMLAGYDRGNDQSFWKYTDRDAYLAFKDTMMDSGADSGQPFPSRFVMACSPWFKDVGVRNTLDLSGDFHSYYHGGSRHLRAEPRPHHYDTCDIYRRFWGWQASIDRQRARNSYLEPCSPTENTVCSLFPIVLRGLQGQPGNRQVPGTDLLRHVSFPGAQDLREGQPMPVPDAEAVQKLLDRFNINVANTMR